MSLHRETSSDVQTESIPYNSIQNAHNFHTQNSKTLGVSNAAVDSLSTKVKISWRALFNFTSINDMYLAVPGVIIATLAGALKPIMSIFLGRVFNELAEYGAGGTTSDKLMKDVSIWCIGLAALALATWCFNSSFFALSLLFGEKQARNAREKMFMGLLEKEIEWYDLQPDGIASLLIRIQTQVRELQIATSQPLGFFIEDSVGCLTAVIIAVYYSWRLTLVILASIPVLVLLTSLATRKLEVAVEKQKYELNRASKYAITAIAHADTIKAYNAQDEEVWQFQGVIKKAACWYLAQANAMAVQWGITRFFMIAIFIQGFWFGLTLVNQEVNAGTILTTFYSVLMAVQAIEALIPQWIILARGISAAETLKNIQMEVKNGRKVTKMIGALTPTTCYGDIKFQDVTFAYPSNPSQVVLNNTTFFFPAGETIFVVGKSGSGKSTLSNLLMKYYESSKGEITIDGNPIQTLSQDWIRNNVSIVQQESVLFNETLFRNIAFGRQQHTTATRADVESACQTALLQQTINDLPDGLDTIISSGGDSMSGGQKQRVAIARARLRNSPILILDEATSALDPLTRTVVMEAIRHWRKGKSTIVITHDITQILLTDFVYVLDAGKIVQEGYRDRLEKVFDGPFSALLSRPADFCHSTPSLHRCSVSADSIYSVAESISSDQVYDRIAHLPSGLSRVSSFLAVKERTRPRSSYLTDRHRSLGMGSMLTTNLRTEVAWGDHTPSVALVRPKSYMNAEISKPTRTVRRSYRSFSIGDQGREDSFELVKITGQSSVAIRSGAAAHSGDIPTTPSMPHRQALSNTEKCTRQIKGDASIPKILKTVWPNLLWPDRLNLISGFLAAFINAACTPSFAYILSRLLNTYHLPNSPERSVLARNWAIVVLGIAIADGVTSYYFHWCLEYSGQVWVDTLRTEALKRILAQPKEWFDKKQNSPAALSEYLDRNAEEMRNLVGRFAGYVWMAFWMVAIAVIWAMIICWRLTLVGLASTPVMFVCTRIFENVAAKWERKTNESGEAASMIFTETFSNIRVVRALTLERYFRLKHSAATAQAYRIGIRRSLYTAFFFGLNDSTSIFVTALVLYYGTVLASTSYPISSVLAVITLLLFSSGNAGSILSLIPQISSSKTTATRVLYLANMAIRPKHELAGTKRLTDPLPIEFRNVNFTYPLRPTVQVLHNINLTFETGSCTAIVGSSGSGKSTIAALLLGLYPPNLPPSNLPTSSGNSTLFFAGVPLSNLHLPSLRSQISYVAQNPVLFPLTVGANISYGLRSPNSPSSLASQSNIQKAAHEAGIHEFIISLPQGYETIVGDGGMTLSGGQAQRVAIARALCRRPRVLVLDEATSALDGESARVIRDTIKKLAGRAAGTSRMRSSSNGGQRGDGMTVIAITHSVEMMRCLRNIVVLENGRVVEEGLFDELVTRGGIFENLVRSGEVEAGV